MVDGGSRCMTCVQLPGDKEERWQKERRSGNRDIRVHAEI